MDPKRDDLPVHDGLPVGTVGGVTVGKRIEHDVAFPVLGSGESESKKEKLKKEKLKKEKRKRKRKEKEKKRNLVWMKSERDLSCARPVKIFEVVGLVLVLEVSRISHMEESVKREVLKRRESP